MSLDLLAVVALLLAATWGAVRGASGQLPRLGGLAAGWLGARALGPRLAPALEGRVPAFAAPSAAAVLAFVGCALAATLVLKLAARLVTGEHGERGGFDRAIGALLGAAQAAVVLGVAISALALWGRPVRLGPLDLDPARSQLAALVRDHGIGDKGRRPSPRPSPFQGEGERGRRP